MTAPIKPLPRYRYACESGRRHPVASIVAIQAERGEVRHVGLTSRAAVLYKLEQGISLYYLKCKCGSYITGEEIK